ncbi:hypothetical protein scyTo_0008938 [Scyliorhinus torazame]|uniref:Lactase-like protein n=1 Tax=Scyliorhinus torazame TaxID=75743 RepID=A0A401PFA3_SCYTO|nr:hypothetical protein [Scyliorhinus torazame]
MILLSSACQQAVVLVQGRKYETDTTGTMPPILHVVSQAFLLLLPLGLSQEFDWTKDHGGSFYYGTFPPGFSWGVGSSAYQTEGAWDQDGKGLSIWDVFTRINGKVHLNETGDSSCESYYKFKALQDRYGGWQNNSLINFFNDYANLCFETFGDRVKHWITFNNPWSTAVEGYEVGEHAPGLRLKGVGAYRAAHNIIKAHAKAWHTYDKLWRNHQKGLVGISITSEWGEPVDITSQKDIEAAERYIQFYLGWFANPIFSGDYPQVMKDCIGRKSSQEGLSVSRLPAFTPQEKHFIKGTADFFGLGHFTTRYITHRNYHYSKGPSYYTDRDLAELVDPGWPDPGSEWLYSVPWGFRRILNYIKSRYGNPRIYVTENGVSEKQQCTELCDKWRMQYMNNYVNEILKAVKDGVKVKGYTSWSLLDKFEWDEGYSERFGLYYIDFESKNKRRYPKASVQYYRKMISSNGFPNQREIESWKRKAAEACSTTNALLAADPLVNHMEMVTEIVVPTVCILCILLSAILLMFVLRRQ